MRRHARARALEAGSTRSARRRGRIGQFFASLALVSLAFALLAGAAAAEPPAVTMGSVSEASYTSAEVTGEVDPKGEFTEWFFELSRDGGGSWERSSVGGGVEGTGSQAVEGVLENLKPGTAYLVRLAALNYTEFVQVNSPEPSPEFTTDAVGAPTVSIAAPTSVATTSAHFSGEIDPEAPAGNPSAYDVQWHFECTPACPGFLGGAIPADSSSHTVEADATGLQPNLEYQVSLVASNAAGPVTAGPEAFATDAALPTTGTIPAFALAGGTRALLGGRVNPNNAATAYWFEYGSDDSYGQRVPASEDGDAGSGGEAKILTEEIAGLSPETVYHFRIVTENATGRSEGEDMTFETAPAITAVRQDCPNAALRLENGSTELAGCRAYEQVSPQEKNGNDVGAGPLLPLEVSSADGSKVVYESLGAFPGSQTATVHNYYLGRRGGQGWSYDPITPPQRPRTQVGSYPVYRSFTEDLRYGFLFNPEGVSLAPGDTPGKDNLYVRDNESGVYRTLNLGGGVSSAVTVGASADLSHVVFESEIPLLPGAQPGHTSLYEWVDGELRLASILPNGEPAEEGRGGGPFGAIGALQPIRNIISEDGSRIFFGAEGQIFVRIDGVTTVKASATQRTVPGAQDANVVEFQGATPDGSAVYFLADGPLTDDAPAGTSLYRFDVESEDLTNLAPPASSANPSAPVSVQSVQGMSSDGSYVYFTATGQLIDGGPQAGIYVWHDGALALVAAHADPGTDYANDIASRVTDDGRYMVFMSNSRVTAYDNADAATDLPASEVYLYDAVAERLACVSCRSDGARPDADAVLTPPSKDTVYNLQRTVSSDGEVFFNTTGALVPGDVNGKLDVYEWSGGAVHLLSSGTSGSPSYFSAASANGDDAFFITREQLVPSDRDANADLYDARVGGGFAQPTQASPCSGEQCQGGIAGRPDFAAPGSRAVDGRPGLSPRARKLRRALKACKRKPPGKARKKCRAKVVKRFGNGSNGRNK